MKYEGRIEIVFDAESAREAAIKLEMVAAEIRYFKFAEQVLARTSSPTGDQ